MASLLDRIKVGFFASHEYNGRSHVNRGAGIFESDRT